MENLSDHSFFQSRPDYYSSWHEFVIFLKITTDDLKSKQEALKAQKQILTHNRTAKSYLSCQLYMLKKHIQRVDRFDAEVGTRLNSILNQDPLNSKDNESKVECNENMDTRITGDQEDVPVKEKYREAAVDCGNLEENNSNLSNSLVSMPHNGSGERLDVTLSSDSIVDESLGYDKSFTANSTYSSNDEIVSDFDYIDSGINLNLASEEKANNTIKVVSGDDSIKDNSLNADSLDIKRSKNNSQERNVKIKIDSSEREFLKLIADMKTMKRRCKHILDVTDKYCVLNNEMDLKLDLQQDEVANMNASLSKSPTTSPWSTRCSSGCSSPVESPSASEKNKTITSEDEVDGFIGGNRNEATLQLPASINDRGLFKVAVNSVGEHLGVFIKTYTRRHSKQAISY